MICLPGGEMARRDQPPANDMDACGSDSCVFGRTSRATPRTATATSPHLTRRTRRAFSGSVSAKRVRGRMGASSTRSTGGGAATCGGTAGAAIAAVAGLAGGRTIFGITISHWTLEVGEAETGASETGAGETGANGAGTNGAGTTTAGLGRVG